MGRMDEDSIETWELRHPDRGMFHVTLGPAAQLTEADPGYPVAKVGRHGVGMVLLRDGKPIARAGHPGSHRCHAAGEPLDDGVGPDHNIDSWRSPSVQVLTSALDVGTIRHIRFRDGDELAEFTPPRGSKAERWQQKVAASPWRRTLYPILGGFGKAGWAIIAILLLPMLLRLIEPLIPSLDLGWSLPEVNVPLPDIDVDLPTLPFSMPSWMEPVIEHPRIWAPILIGCLAAVFASRQTRRIRRTHDQWAQRENTTSA